MSGPGGWQWLSLRGRRNKQVSAAPDCGEATCLPGGLRVGCETTCWRDSGPTTESGLLAFLEMTHSQVMEQSWKPRFFLPQQKQAYWDLAPQPLPLVGKPWGALPPALGSLALSLSMSDRPLKGAPSWHHPFQVLAT